MFLFFEFLSFPHKKRVLLSFFLLSSFFSFCSFGRAPDSSSSSTLFFFRVGFCGGCGCCCERSAGRPYLRAFFFFRLFPSLFLQFNLLFEAFFLSPGTQVFPVCVLRLVCVAFFSFGAFLWAMHASPRPRQSLVPWFFLRLFSSSSFFFLLLPKAGARLFSFFSRTFLVFFSVAQSKRLAYDMKRDLSHKSNPGTTHTSKTKKKKIPTTKISRATHLCRLFVLNSKGRPSLATTTQLKKIARKRSRNAVRMLRLCAQHPNNKQKKSTAKQAPP